MKSTIYANIFIEHLDAVRMFKLLNILETEEFFRFINSFSVPSLLRRTHHARVVRARLPMALFRFISRMFTVWEEASAKCEPYSVLTLWDKTEGKTLYIILQQSEGSTSCCSCPVSMPQLHYGQVPCCTTLGCSVHSLVQFSCSAITSRGRYFRAKTPSCILSTSHVMPSSLYRTGLKQISNLNAVQLELWSLNKFCRVAYENATSDNYN